jgi:hypothetical protein
MWLSFKAKTKDFRRYKYETCSIETWEFQNYLFRKLDKGSKQAQTDRIMVTVS